MSLSSHTLVPAHVKGAIDTHVHPWRISNLPPVIECARTVRPDLAEDFSPARLVDTIKQGGFSSVIFVHARDPHEDSVGEARFFIQAAQEHSEIVGAVIGANLLDPQGIASMLDALGNSPVVRGVRMIAPENTGIGTLSDPRAKDTIALLGERGLSLDLLIRCRNEGQLREAVDLVQWASVHTKTTIIGDHLLKPTGIAEGAPQTDWRSALTELGACPTFFMKLSGLPGEVPPGSNTAVFHPFYDAAFEAFGPAKLMFGSDHPVSYGHLESVAAVATWMASRGIASGPEAQYIFSDTARTAYRV
jgi:L-fuconolactonase